MIKSAAKNTLLNIAILALVLILFKVTAYAESSSVNSIYSRDITNISSLMSAVMDGDVEGVKFFAKGGDKIVNQKNLGGASALHIAARSNNPNSSQIVEILIDNGANVNATDNEKWTPLMRAALAKNDKAVDSLITKGADVTKRNSLKETAIVNSASSGCSQCLRSIFSKSNYNQMRSRDLDQELKKANDIAFKKNDNESQNVLTEARQIIKLKRAAKAKSKAGSVKKKNIIVGDLDPKPSVKTPVPIKAVKKPANSPVKSRRKKYNFSGQKIISEKEGVIKSSGETVPVNSLSNNKVKSDDLKNKDLADIKAMTQKSRDKTIDKAPIVYVIKRGSGATIMPQKVSKKSKSVNSNLEGQEVAQAKVKPRVRKVYKFVKGPSRSPVNPKSSSGKLAVKQSPASKESKINNVPIAKEQVVVQSDKEVNKIKPKKKFKISGVRKVSANDVEKEVNPAVSAMQKKTAYSKKSAVKEIEIDLNNFDEKVVKKIRYNFKSNRYNDEVKYSNPIKSKKLVKNHLAEKKNQKKVQQERVQEKSVDANPIIKKRRVYIFKKTIDETSKFSNSKNSK